MLVVEDNDLHFFKLESCIEELGHVVAGRATSGDEVMRLIRATNPHIVLLDVQLMGEEDGISVSSRINEEYDLPVIFTTSSKDSVTIRSAVKTNPAGYLIKPIGKEELQAALELAMHREQEDSNATIQDDAFFIKTDKGLDRVEVEDISWIANAEQEKYLDVFTSSGNSYNIRQSLRAIQEKLPDHFVRVSSTHIINARKIQRINDELMTIQVDDQEIKMSRKYRAELKGRLNFLS